MSSITRSLEVPYQDPITSEGSLLTRPWEWFFRTLTARVYPLGQELSFDLVNNQASAADVTGLRFNYQGISQAIVEFLVQRVTTSTGATELIETGLFIASYKPTSNTWALNLVSINSPQNSGVDFTITSSGQVQYTSSNITGTASISKLFYRARTLGGKNALYSSVGDR